MTKKAPTLKALRPHSPSAREARVALHRCCSRTLVVLVAASTMAATLILGSGVALAATTIHCPNDPSQGSPSSLLFCYGTAAADSMYGSDLADFMFSKGGNDTMHGYGGSDRLQADKGSDNVYGDDGADAFLWGGAYDGSTNYYPDTSDD